MTDMPAMPQPIDQAGRDASDREIVIVRRFDAPAALVFRMWTDPALVARWWAPAGFTTTVTALDPRPGGEFRLVMHGADGTDYPMKAGFHEVRPPTRLVYSDDWDPEWDDVNRPSRPSVVTVDFDERDGKTTLTLRILYATPADRAAAAAAGVEWGWNSCFDILADALAAAGDASDI